MTGWKEPSVANKEFYDEYYRITETEVGNNIFKGKVKYAFDNGDYLQFRFYTSLPGWDHDGSIGLADNQDFEFDANGKYEGKILSDSRYEGNYKFPVTSAGTLDVTVNLNTNKVTFVYTKE